MQSPLNLLRSEYDFKEAFARAWPNTILQLKFPFWIYFYNQNNTLYITCENTSCTNSPKSKHRAYMENLQHSRHMN